MFQEFTGKEYIKIAIANAYGLDKETWGNRLIQVESFITGSGLQSFVDSAEEPLLMQKAIKAYEDAEAGIPTGYIMGLDATNSGLQIMACLIGCEKTALSTNLIFNGKRNDAYGIVTDTMNKYVSVALSRKEMKDPVMTYFYGSKAEPEKAFGKDTSELMAFYKALEEEFPGACEIMDDIQGCWQGDALYHQWTLPDKHVARVLVTTTVDKKIEIDELDHTTFTYRAKVNTTQYKGVSLAANVIHSIDAYVVREMYRMAHAQGFELLTIHDAFFCSPNHMNKLRRNYNTILSKIAASNLLQNILNEITGSNGVLTKKSNRLSKLILESNYSLS